MSNALIYTIQVHVHDNYVYMIHACMCMHHMYIVNWAFVLWASFQFRAEPHITLPEYDPKA